ncbi:MAG: YbaB/EbfC family nucleoid-associated protein [bacterium]
MVKGMDGVLKQAQQLQSKMSKLQEEMANKTVEASAGGGMVTVVANGKQQIVSIKIDPEIVDPGDIEMLQDVVLAAVNSALEKAQEMMANAMAGITGNMKIPGLF